MGLKPFCSKLFQALPQWEILHFFTEQAMIFKSWSRLQILISPHCKTRATPTTGQCRTSKTLWAILPNAMGRTHQQLGTSMPSCIRCEQCCSRNGNARPEGKLNDSTAAQFSCKKGA